MTYDIPIIEPHDMIDAVLGQLEASRCPAAPVVEGGRLTGLLTMDAVAEFLSIQAALRRAPV
jgi:CBS domain-containing protein